MIRKQYCEKCINPLQNVLHWDLVLWKTCLYWLNKASFGQTRSVQSMHVSCNQIRDSQGWVSDCKQNPPHSTLPIGWIQCTSFGNFLLTPSPQAPSFISPAPEALPNPVEHIFMAFGGFWRRGWGRDIPLHRGDLHSTLKGPNPMSVWSEKQYCWLSPVNQLKGRNSSIFMGRLVAH